MMHCCLNARFFLAACSSEASGCGKPSTLRCVCVFALMTKHFGQNKHETARRRPNMSVWPYNPVLYSSCSSETPSEKTLGKYQQMGASWELVMNPHNQTKSSPSCKCLVWRRLTCVFCRPTSGWPKGLQQVRILFLVPLVVCDRSRCISLNLDIALIDIVNGKYV